MPAPLLAIEQSAGGVIMAIAAAARLRSTASICRSARGSTLGLVG
jgi:hypothetical protein